MDKAEFGRLSDGTVVFVYTLDNGRGMRARVMTLGATLIGLEVPDRSGTADDVVLGFDTLEPYVKGHPFLGSTVGRYGNRIAGGRFTLEGREYRLATNNGPNHLHGGPEGFDKKVWAAKPAGSAAASVAFSYTSPDGEAGYPGTLDVTVTYTLTDGALRIEYTATTDASTPVNLTNHSYFNLRGGRSGANILGHEATFPAHHYTPVDENLIPTGEISSVEGTPFDFTAPHLIGARIGSVPGSAGGYDHNIVRDGGQEFGLAARVYEPTTGRVLEMHTDQPGFQFYTGNFLDGTLEGKGGTRYPKHGAFCLEAQHFPDSPNKPQFPQTILNAGETYRQRTDYHFSAR